MNQTKLNIRGGQSSLNQTWTDVTAQRIHQIVESLLQCTAVRVHLPDSKDKSLTELLTTVKLLIVGAYVMKQLQSGDIKVAVSDQHTKNCVLNQPQVENL